MNKSITITEASCLIFFFKKKKDRKMEGRQGKEERNESQKVRETRSPDHDTDTFFTTKFARDLFINHIWRKKRSQFCWATCASKVRMYRVWQPVNDGLGVPDKLIRRLRRVISKILSTCSAISPLGVEKKSRELSPACIINQAQIVARVRIVHVWTRLYYAKV